MSGFCRHDLKRRDCWEVDIFCLQLTRSTYRYKQCTSLVAIVRLLHTNSDHFLMITLSICIFLHVMVATLMNVCRHTECMQNIHLNGNRRVKCYYISKSYSTLRAFIISNTKLLQSFIPRLKYFNNCIISSTSKIFGHCLLAMKYI